MNKARINAEENFFVAHEPYDGEVGDHASIVLAGLDAVCAETEWLAFKSQLRCHGPQMRQALERLWEFPPPDTSAEHISLVEHLERLDVDEQRITCLEHADRMILRATSIAHILEDHGVDLSDEGVSHKQNGDLAVWMYRFARLVLWHVASGRVSADAPCLRFAITLAVDEARDAYAYYATALESSEGTAASFTAQRARETSVAR